MVNDRVHERLAVIVKLPVACHQLPLPVIRKSRQTDILAHALDRDIELAANAHHEVKINLLVIPFDHAVERLRRSVQTPCQLTYGYALVVKNLL